MTTKANRPASGTTVRVPDRYAAYGETAVLIRTDRRSKNQPHFVRFPDGLELWVETVEPVTADDAQIGGSVVTYSDAHPDVEPADDAIGEYVAALGTRASRYHGALMDIQLELIRAMHADKPLHEVALAVNEIVAKATSPAVAS